MELDYVAIGKRVRNEREKKKLSQMRLAELANMSVNSISHIECGNTKFSLPSIVSISAFVGAVRDAYTDILERIAQSCFKEKLFIFSQSNRIACLILEKYNERADFPFSKVTDGAVFRYPKNRKWYGLIMAVKRSVLTKQADDEKDTVEIINLKADESKRDEILKINGIYPAYHMNHEKWISVVLDDIVSDEMLMQLVDA